MLISTLMQFFLIFFPISQRTILNNLSTPWKLPHSILLLLLCGVSIGISKLTVACLQTKLCIVIQHDLQLKLITNGIEDSNTIIETRGAGAYISTVYGDCEQLANLISVQLLWSMVLSIAQIAMTLAITLRWTYSFLIIISIAYAAVIICLWLSNRVSMPEFQKFREILMWINPKILESLENRISTLGYANFSITYTNIDRLFAQRDTHVLKSEMAVQVSSAVISWFALASQITLIIVSTHQLSTGTMQLGDLVALISYMSIIFTPITTIKSSWEQLNRFKILEERIHGMLYREERKPLTTYSPYTFHNCTVTYEENDVERIIFKDFNKTFSGITGLVGLSGAGKTSLIHTMLGKFSPKCGRCCIGPRSVTEFSFHTLLSFIRYYPQTPEIFDESLEFNITLGKQRISRNEFNRLVIQKHQEIEKAVNSCKLGELTAEIIDKFNLRHSQQVQSELSTLAGNSQACLQYATILLNCDYYIQEKYVDLIHTLDLNKIGDRKLGTRGSSISGGEKHKIALARFLLPEGASFFILDEPFSNIDILSLKKCIEVFQKYCPCKHGVIVSHDLHIIRGLCNSILVLEEGETPLSGNHEALIHRSVLYQKLSHEFDQFHSR